MILDAFRLDGRVALVTGASRGLGQGMAIALAEAGANVAGLDRCTSEETQAAVQAAGRRYQQVCCDLAETSVEGLRRVVADVEAALGPVDILINNAGIIRRVPALEFSEADWDDVMQINLRSVFLLSQAIARGMAERGGGKIINIASMLSFQGGILVPSYTAAKSGVAGLTRALANEWARHGINVNAIAPGDMATDNTAREQGHLRPGRLVLCDAAARHDRLAGRFPRSRLVSLDGHHPRGVGERVPNLLRGRADRA